MARQVSVHEAPDWSACPPQKGAVVRPANFGVLRQDRLAFDAFRVLDTVVNENARLSAALETQQLYAKADMTNKDGMRLSSWSDASRRDSYAARERHGAILLRARTVRSDPRRRWPRPSRRKRYAVPARRGALRPPAALLLDEPTNHLDLNSIHSLQDFLVRYDGTLIVIRTISTSLNSICTHTTISTTRRWSPTPAATTTWCSQRHRWSRGFEADNTQQEQRSPS